MAIDPDIRAFIDETQAFYPADRASRGVEERRSLYEAYAQAFGFERAVALMVEDGALAVGGRSIPLRLYRPAGPLPRRTVIYAHGGGYILGSLDSHDGIVARLAARTGADVIAIDYRLAPEHRYPAAHDDGLAVVEAVGSGTAPFADLAATPLVLCGDSAGATVMASAALRTTASLAGLALVYAGLGFEPTAPARDEEAEAPMLSLSDTRYYRAQYLGGAQPEPWAYPLEAPSLGVLPPTFLLAAEHDPLRDDSVAFAARMREAGVACECVIGRGLVHGFLRAIDRSKVAAEAFDRLTRFIAGRLAA